MQELCEKFEIKERTLHEDIKYLKQHLAREIVFDHVKGGYYNVDPGKRLPSFELSSGEVFALTLGKELLSIYTGTSFEVTLRSALEKISERLPEKSASKSGRDQIDYSFSGRCNCASECHTLQ